MAVPAKDRASKITKNALLLYIRFFFVLLANLYISRIVLEVLGVQDYGIYCLVNGMVISIQAISSPLAGAIMRFFTFELGTGLKDKLTLLFSIAVQIQFFLAVFVGTLGYGIMYVFVNKYLNIPSDCLDETNIVLALCTATFSLNLLKTPYYVSVIAHEEMGFYSIMSVIEASLVLILCAILPFVSCNKLITYSVILVAVTCFILLIYFLFCRYKFEECRFKLLFDKKLFSEMLSFSGWNLFGNGAVMLNCQGVNILFNLFYGLIFNSARGLSIQVQSAIEQLVANITTAFSPQITKAYASGDVNYLLRLIYRGTKYSYFMLLVFVVPLILECEFVLDIWLDSVPPYTVAFVQLSIIVTMISVCSNCLIVANLAAGNIKKYQIIVGSTLAMVFPLTFVAFYFQVSPNATYYIYMLIQVICTVERVYLMKDRIPIQFKDFFKETLIKIISITLVCFGVGGLIYSLLNEGVFRFLIIFGVNFLTLFSIILFFMLDPEEVDFLKSKLQAILNSRS